MAGDERFHRLTLPFERNNRTVFVAVTGSLLLHLALLLFLATPRDVQWQRTKAGDPLYGRLVQPSQPISPPASESAPDLKETNPNPAPVQRKPALAKSQHKPNPTPPSIALEPAVPKDNVSPAPQPGQATGSEALDAGSLAQYRIALIGAAKRYKGYPSLALENRWQGKVEVRMAIAIDGSIASLEVRSSTGHAVLDQHALAMIEQAKGTAHIPPALRGRQFAVEVPVVFSLQQSGS